MNFPDAFGTKKILILGFGREGQDVLRFLRGKFPAKEIGIADTLAKRQLPRKAKKAIEQWCKGTSCEFYFGSRYLQAIPRYDIIIKSPGIPLRRIPTLRKDQILTSETKIFFDLFPGIIIGVTGTKGKSTTAKLIHAILKRKFPSAVLMGNIGKPALRALPTLHKKSVVVYELSSFQLADLSCSPHIAVLLNIFPEHLDWHGSFKQYKKAKERIVKYQKKRDFCLYDGSNRYAAAVSKTSQGKKISFWEKGVISWEKGVRSLFLEKKAPDPFFTDPFFKVPFGMHPKTIAAARAVGTLFHVSQKAMDDAISAFRTLDHRIEYAGKRCGIRFYDDSISTIPESAIWALDTLGSDVETLIAGGYDRGIKFDGLAKRIVGSSVKNIIIFPPSGRRIKAAIKKFQTFLLRQRLRTNKADFRFQNTLNFFHVKGMEEAVRLAYRYTSKGKMCLLSPASPSFGIFQDYEERGDLFQKYVRMKRCKRS